MKCFIPATRSEQIADIIQFFPQKIDFPSMTLNEHLLNALDKIAVILFKKIFGQYNDILQVDSTRQQAIEFLTKLLKTAVLVPDKADMVVPSSFQHSMPHQAQILRVSPQVKSPPVAISAPEATASPKVPRVDPPILPPLMPQFKFKDVKSKDAVNHVYHESTSKKMTLQILLKNPATTKIWSLFASNEFGCLMVCNVQLLKQEQYCCCLGGGGDKLPYTSDSAANLIEFKILFNSVISTKGAKFMTIDIRKIFLSSHLYSPEHMKIHQDDSTQDILQQYKAHQFQDTKE